MKQNLRSRKLWLNNKSWKSINKKISKPITKNMLIKLYTKTNLNTEEVGKKLNCGASTITRYLYFYNIPIKKRLPKKYSHHGYNVAWNTKDQCYDFIHRRNMETKIKRKLRYNEIVHHIDGNKNNNATKNLYLLLRKQHMEYYKWLIKKFTNKKTFSQWLKEFKEQD